VARRARIAAEYHAAYLTFLQIAEPILACGNDYAQLDQLLERRPGLAAYQDQLRHQVDQLGDKR